MAPIKIHNIFSITHATSLISSCHIIPFLFLKLQLVYNYLHLSHFISEATATFLKY
jgi:hypothetical protein